MLCCRTSLPVPLGSVPCDNAQSAACQVDMPYVASFIEAHAAQAKAIGKPCVIEEFGKFVGTLLCPLFCYGVSRCPAEQLHATSWPML